MGDRWPDVRAHPNATALPVAHGGRATSTLLAAAAANPQVQQSNVGRAAAQPEPRELSARVRRQRHWRAAGTGRGRRAHTRSGQAASIPRPGPGHTGTHRRRARVGQRRLSQQTCALVRIAPYQPSRSQAPQARGCKKNFPSGSETNQGSRDESQRIAAWKLLYRVRHPDPYVSRLQTIPHSDVGSSRDLDSKESCSLL
jgi:hypothetical protein